MSNYIDFDGIVTLIGVMYTLKNTAVKNYLVNSCVACMH